MSKQSERIFNQEDAEISVINKHRDQILTELKSDRFIINSDDNMIKLVVTADQTFHSIDLSMDLFAFENKKEIELRLLKVVNKAIRETRKRINDKFRDSILPNVITGLLSVQKEKGIYDVSRMEEQLIKEKSKPDSGNNKLEINQDGIYLIVNDKQEFLSLIFPDGYYIFENKDEIEQQLLKILNLAIKETYRSITKWVNKIIDTDKDC